MVLKQLRQIAHVDPTHSLGARLRTNIRATIGRDIYAGPIAIAHTKANTRCTDYVARAFIERSRHYELCPCLCI